MKLMKFMPAALLLCFSLGAFAQDEDLTEEVAGEEEVEDVFVPKTPIEKKFFQRVQLGFMGTNVKYTNFGLSPDYNNYFLKGIGFGWMGDFKIAKKYPIYFEIGAMFTYHTGRSKGDSIYTYHNEPGSSGVQSISSSPYSLNRASRFLLAGVKPIRHEEERTILAPVSFTIYCKSFNFGHLLLSLIKHFY